MGCGQSFCRECVSEHDLRMLCAECLRREASGAKPKAERRHLPVFALQFLGGLLLLWFTLWLAGRILVEIPVDFHDGKVWSNFATFQE
jgi:hypothetical protein